MNAGAGGLRRSTPIGRWASQNHPKTIPKSSQNHRKTIPNPSQIHPKIQVHLFVERSTPIGRWASQNHPKTIPKPSQNPSCFVYFIYLLNGRLPLVGWESSIKWGSQKIPRASQNHPETIPRSKFIYLLIGLLPLVGWESSIKWGSPKIPKDPKSIPRSKFVYLLNKRHRYDTEGNKSIQHAQTLTFVCVCVKHLLSA